MVMSSKTIDDNNIIIYTPEIIVDIIILINSDIINDIINDIVHLSSSLNPSIHKLFDLVKIKVLMQLTRVCCCKVKLVQMTFCKQIYPVSITLKPNLDRIKASL